MSVAVKVTNADTSSEIELTIVRDVLLNYPLMWRLTKQELLEVVAFNVFVRPSNNTSVLYITSDDHVYGMGENGYEVNILGVDDCHFRCDQVDRPCRVEGLSGKRIKSIKVGGEIGAALSEEGLMYWWGKKSLWRDNDIVLPERTLGPDCRVISFSCGYAMIAALDEKGVVHTWGPFDYKNTNCSFFNRYKLDHPVVSLSCGLSHLAMVANGQAYTCGIGSHGQRGFSTYPSTDERKGFNRDTRKKIELNEPCKSVVCGPLSTFFVTASGKVWACGANCGQHGYLGISNKEPIVNTTEKVELDTDVKYLLTLSNPQDYCTALAFTGDGIYSWSGEGQGSPCRVNDVEVHNIVSSMCPTNVMICVQQPSLPRPMSLSLALQEKLELASKLLADLQLDSQMFKECHGTEDPPNIAIDITG